MESELPALIEKNPQLEVVTVLSRGQHPYLKGEYNMKDFYPFYLFSFERL